MVGRLTIHDILLQARTRYVRLEPESALAAMTSGALLIDIRDSDQRHRDGTIPGALIIDRTVLEWRVDPDSWGHPRGHSRPEHATDPDLQPGLLLQPRCRLAPRPRRRQRHRRIRRIRSLARSRPADPARPGKADAGRQARRPGRLVNLPGAGRTSPRADDDQ